MVPPARVPRETLMRLKSNVIPRHTALVELARVRMITVRIGASGSGASHRTRATGNQDVEPRHTRAAGGIHHIHSRQLQSPRADELPHWRRAPAAPDAWLAARGGQ